jgi:hypothetical protein
LVISGLRGIFDDRGAAGEGRRHHDGVGRADRDFWEMHRRADEAALGRLGDDIAFVDVDFGAQFLEAEEEEIDGTRADGAAARQRDARLVSASQ